MAIVDVKVLKRFAQLSEQAKAIPMRGERSISQLDFYAWAASAHMLLGSVFGNDSPHYQMFKSEIDGITNNYIDERMRDACIGIFMGAKSDADGGHIYDFRAEVSGEILGDFIVLAKAALSEGHVSVACVLASAALEDALKRVASASGIHVEGKVMEEVIHAMKGQGLVSGSDKALLTAMPKIRNSSMHADWDKLTSQDAGSILGYVEQFVLSKFR